MITQAVQTAVSSAATTAAPPAPARPPSKLSTAPPTSKAPALPSSTAGARSAAAPATTVTKPAAPPTAKRPFQSATAPPAVSLTASRTPLPTAVPISPPTLKPADAAVDVAPAADLPGLEGLLKQPREEAVRGPSERVYDGRSLCCLRPGSMMRRAAIFLVESKVFDPFILLMIVCNCVTMAWSSPLDPAGTWKDAFIQSCEQVYLFVFTFELMIKILAYGFLFTTGAYLKDPWCQLDFIVVTLAWVPKLYPSFGNYSAIRSVRALRPLRALKRIPGMPALVSSILNSLPPLANVAGLCGFLFFIFGIVGLEMFKGVLHYRCAEAGFVAGGDEQDAFDTGVFCAKDATMCEVGTTCEYFDENPEDGLVSFDSVFMAGILILQVITFDTWTDAMWAVSAAETRWAWIYFLAVLILGDCAAPQFPRQDSTRPTHVILPLLQAGETVPR